MPASWRAPPGEATAVGSEIGQEHEVPGRVRAVQFPDGAAAIGHFDAAAAAVLPARISRNSLLEEVTAGHYFGSVAEQVSKLGGVSWVLVGSVPV